MGATFALDLAPYSYSVPAASSLTNTLPYITSAGKAILSSAASAGKAALSTAASTGQAALPYLATTGQIAWPLLAVGGGTALGLYTLANAKNGAVSGAIRAAAERERQRHLAEAEAKWQEKNQNYADLIDTYGSIQYPAGTFYNYDPSTGTAYLEKDLGNGRIGRWTQNMRTYEQGNPYVYDPATGEIYPGEMTSPHSAYVQMPKTIRLSPVEVVGSNSTPITLSTGQTVSLPIDITDYRVFDESAGDNPESGSGAGAGEGSGAGVGGGSPQRDNDDDKDNQISSVEEYVRKFGKNMDRRTARRIRNSERISHDANGNINRHATRLLNRGVKAGAEGAKSGGFPWQTFLFGTSVGGGLTLGGQAIFGNKEVKAPELHGDVTHVDRTKSLIDRAIQGETESSEQTETPPIQGDSIEWDKIKL